MDTSQFQLCVEGSGVTPATIDVADLVVLLSEFRKAVCLAAGISQEGNEDGGPVVSLVSIEPGSSRLRLAASQVALAGAMLLTDAVRNETYSGVPLEARTSLARMSALVVKREWELTLGPESGYAEGVRSATISRDHPVPDPDADVMRGATTIYGRCMRVGGEKPVLRVKLAQTQETISVEVSEELAKELGQHLYEDVAIEGEAIWRVSDWKIEAFRARRVLSYQPAPAAHAFEELATASNGRWDEIDAGEYVRRLRSEEDE
jgi:hypothetical protein